MDETRSVPSPRPPRWRSVACIGAVIAALSLVMVTVPLVLTEVGIVHPDIGFFIALPILAIACAAPLAGLICVLALGWGLWHSDARTIAWGAGGVVAAALTVAFAVDTGIYRFFELLT